MPVTPEWLSALTALVAVVVGPIVSVLLSRREIRASLIATQKQIDASTVSVSRQQWINAVRDSLAEYLAVTEPPVQLVGSGIEVVSPDLERRRERAEFLRARIDLLLNPAEDDHQALVHAVDQLRNIAFVPGSERAPERTVFKKALLERGQRVFKREWERVKAGEPEKDDHTRRLRG